jgi:hypothetical protein
MTEVGRRRTLACVPHYALVMDDGDALGLVELRGGADAWLTGSLIAREPGPDLRVIGHHSADDPERFSVLVVETVE